MKFTYYKFTRAFICSKNKLKKKKQKHKKAKSKSPIIYILSYPSQKQKEN